MVFKFKKLRYLFGTHMVMFLVCPKCLSAETKIWLSKGKIEKKNYLATSLGQKCCLLKAMIWPFLMVIR
jgi:hypothetical protein